MINPDSGTIEHSTHRFPVRVYYSDTDAGGIVYHSRYLDMAEHARTELLRIMGGSQQEMLHQTGTGFVVSSLSIDYKKPGKLDDALLVETQIGKLERFSLVFRQKVIRGEEVLADLKVKAANIDLTSGRPQAFSDELRKKMGDYFLPG